jgi:acyl-CoA synthetase (NDP forming)
MLGARSVAVVGASARPGSFGERVVTELRRSPSAPGVHLVNPRYPEVLGSPCVPSLTDVDEPVDLVLLAVGDDRLEEQLTLAAARGDRSAVVFGSAHSPGDSPAAPSLRERLATIATDAGMALCGGGCMGFVELSRGLRALGYLERPDLPAGPVALVSHSGSAFSALLRARRQVGWTSAVSSGQELVTTTADYVQHALDDDRTRVVALVLETVRRADLLRPALDRAAAQDVAVVLLAVGGTPAGAGLVTAHSGALAGPDATWEALTEAHGLLRVEDLDEMTDLLELLTTGRRARRGGHGIASVHDSGAERVLVADTAAREGVRFADLAGDTRTALSALLDPGLEVGNPLDVWGTGRSTRELVTASLVAMAADPGVAAVALAVDLVEEYDGDDSYPLAALDAAASTDLPLAVLPNLGSAVDEQWAARLRAGGVPVLTGTRSGLRALGHLMTLAERSTGRPTGEEPPAVDSARRQRWLDRLGSGPLSSVEAYALLRDYRVVSVEVLPATTADEVLAAADAVGWPVVLKTDQAVAHKSELRGVHLGLADPAAVAAAYQDLADRLGPSVLVCSTAPDGVELSVGIADDPLLGPVVVVAAGGVLVELLADRAVALPPLPAVRAGRLLDRLRCRPLLDGHRGRPPADLGAVASAIGAMGVIATELGAGLRELDVNPLVCGPGGAVAADVLVVPR